MERYLAIAYSMKLKTWDIVRKTKILMAVYLLISLALPSYVFTHIGVIIFPSFGPYCVTFPQKLDSYYTLDIIVMRFICNGVCGVIVSIFTVLIVINLFKARKMRVEMTGVNASNIELKVSAMMAAIAIIYLITKIPYFIATYITSYGKTETEDAKTKILINKSVFGWFIEAKPITGAFTDLNYAVNFVIYVIFLQQFQKVLFCKKQGQKNHKSALSTSGAGVDTMSTNT